MKKNKILILIIALLSSINMIIIKTLQKKNLLLDEKREKFKRYYICLNNWMYNLHLHINLADYIIERKYNTVAIYGMGEIGKRLYEELIEKNINVKYAIDNYGDYDIKIKIYEINEELPEVDLIIVTPIHEFENILTQLKEKINSDIISIDEMILQLNKNYNI